MRTTMEWHFSTCHGNWSDYNANKQWRFNEKKNGNNKATTTSSSNNNNNNDNNNDNNNNNKNNSENNNNNNNNNNNHKIHETNNKSNNTTNGKHKTTNKQQLSFLSSDEYECVCVCVFATFTVMNHLACSPDHETATISKTLHGSPLINTCYSSYILKMH